MLVQTSSADIPVTLSNHTNTTPSPQIVVRNVKHERVRDILEEEENRLISDPEDVNTYTYKSAGTGTPRLFTRPKILGAWPERASDISIRELAKKHEFVADRTAVRSTALTTCVAAPNPARLNTTVIGEAATSESVVSAPRIREAV
jgi:hypothetical protein